MRAIIICVIASVLLLCSKAFGENFVRNRDFEKKLDNLFFNKPENYGEIGEFFKLGFLSDEKIIEARLEITNYKKQIQTTISEIIAENNFEEPSDEDRIGINELWKVIHRCSELEDRIWILLKSRKIWEEKERKGKLAEKNPPRPMN